MVNGDKNGDRTTFSGSCTTAKVKTSCQHQLLPPEIRHVVREFAQEFNSSQSGAKGFSCYEHDIINIAYRWGDLICVGVDSKLSDSLTGDFSTIPEESHRMELAANLAYQFVSPYGTVCSLVLGWDNTSPHPQMFRVIAGESFTTSDSDITALSRSPRTYSQAATWRALQLITSFISVANTLATRRETTRIQLNAQKKIETEGTRVESLNKRLSMTHGKITTLEQMMCKISKRLFVHCYRYREIDPNIWISCTESLAVWIISYPSLFLQDVYLKYIGLALKDKRAGVRNAFVHALKNVCEIDANVPILGRFTRRFSSQMIDLSSDIDISVAISATAPVKQLLRHQHLPPEIRHVVRALEYEQLIAQESNSSQSGAKGFSCYEHGTINISYRWGNFICVGVDSKLTNSSTGDVTNLNYNKFHQISRNIYITMAGFRMSWERMCQSITTEFSTIPEESHKVELAANLAYQFVSPPGTVGSLVLGWDNTSPHPQMFRVIAGESFTTSDSAMALGTGEEYVNLPDLTDYYHGELAHAFQHTMLLLNQACLLDPFCGGVVRGRVLQRDQPPSCTAEEAVLMVNR